MLDARELRDLARELDDLRERRDDAETTEPLDDEDRARLKALEGLERDLNGDIHVFANHGGALVADDDQKQIAQEAVEDRHGRGSLSAWPFTAIDWDQATKDYFTDWTCIEFDGETYYTQDA